MKSSTTTTGHQIGLFIANVFQDNRDYERCRKLIRQYDPELILLVETDDEWWQAMDEFRRDYPYVICRPQPNTYGICLLSKLVIRNKEVRFLIEKDVPSLVADLVDQQGREFRLYGLHPKPPVPDESKESTERDAEILIVGREAKKSSKPVIVAGDLNDVAWSYTTNLFLKVSNLLDPRIGRGFFSTFHASHRLLRWPLDHVFLSSHFTLTTIKRLPHIGSDHFPIYIQVVLLNKEDRDNLANEKKANHSQVEVAREKIHDASAKVE
jgi:endonuclease/exonuclease/phosphatase (EEP) superfamily protein YafD